MNLILLFAVLHHASLKMCHIQIVICEQILDLTPQEAKLNQYSNNLNRSWYVDKYVELRYVLKIGDRAK
jgi:hypothetical protein